MSNPIAEGASVGLQAMGNGLASALDVIRYTIILLVLVCIAGCGGCGYLAYQNYKLENQKKVEQSG